MSRVQEDPRLIELALTVSDSHEVDWDKALEESPDLAPALAQLRVVARVAEQAGREAASVETAPQTALFDWGPLRVVKRIGAGSFGEVFAAWDPRLHRTVALKLRRIDDGDGESGALQWLLEARRLASVHHPNVLDVYGADVHEGRAGIWTELVSGLTLEEALARQGVFGASEAALIGMDLCAALSAVHGAGLLHGDVKAANVMRCGAATGDVHASGRIVLMDFGAARERGSGATHGTPLGAAPELLRGEPAAVASDVYAAGVLLFRLVSGRYPYEADSLGELREKVARGERTPLRSVRPELPRSFLDVVERALDADPERRFASAAEMERALGETVRPVAPGRRGLGPALMLFAAALAVLVIIGVVTLTGRRALDRPAAGLDRASPAPSGEQPGSIAPATGGTASTPDPSAAPAPAAPRVDATLFMVNGALREPLRSGDRVGPGDRLGLELESGEAIHAYVLDEDETGNVVALFPLAGSGTTNPLAAGLRHRLPGADRDHELHWQVTSAGGRERILVLASRERLPSIERVLAAARSASDDGLIEYPRLGEAALLELRGIAGIAREPATAGPASGSRLERIAGRLTSRRAPVWTRLFVLENPSR